MAVQGHRIPLATPYRSRSGTLGKDGEMLNCAVAKDALDGSIYVSKRPGTGFTQLYNAYAGYNSSTNPGRGCIAAYVAGTSQRDYFLFHLGTNSNIYRENDNTYLMAAMASGTAYAWLAQDTDYVYCMAWEVGPGSKELYVAPKSTVTWALVTDVDCPTNIGTGVTDPVAGIVPLDTYLFMATAGGRIYNSDVGAPTAWTATNFTTRSQTSSVPVALKLHNNHLALLCDTGIEFFYNAGYTQGSPLARREDAYIPVGCKYANAIGEFEGDLFFIAKNENGSLYVAMLRGFNITRISTPEVEALLNREESLLTNTANATTTGCCVGWEGGAVYTLTVPTGTDETYRTLVYDLATGIWSRWTLGSDTHFRIWGVANIDSAFSDPNTDVDTIGPIVMTDYGLMRLSSTLYRDETTDAGYATMTSHIITPLYTGEAGQSGVRKFLPELRVVGDVDTTDSFTVSYSDDDYGSWINAGTLVRGFDYALRALGSFYRRAFKIEHTANKAFRAKFVEIGVDVGRR